MSSEGAGVPNAESGTPREVSFSLGIPAAAPGQSRGSLSHSVGSRKFVMGLRGTEELPPGVSAPIDLHPWRVVEPPGDP